MPALATAPDFEQALGDLQAHLPSWWRSSDPTSQLYKLLLGFASIIDTLSADWERPYLDQVLTTASTYGLLHNFAFAWGVTNEQLPTFLPQLVAYLQARALEDGSLTSLVNTLTSLVNTPANTTGGDILTFPSNGSGLIFPDPTGANLIFPMTGGIALPATFGGQQQGLIMWEFPAGQAPTANIGLIFPSNGSGLTFPLYPSSLPSENVIVNDGTTPIGAGPGLIFASNQFVQITQDFINYRLTVSVPNWATFDRGAFARAVARFQPADWYPTLIQETTIYH